MPKSFFPVSGSHPVYVSPSGTADRGPVMHILQSDLSKGELFFIQGPLSALWLCGCSMGGHEIICAFPRGNLGGLGGLGGSPRQTMEFIPWMDK